MGQRFENLLETNVTMVSNQFIDEYMAEANGEYVKVYLYLLRQGGDSVTLVEVADALNHTEADVRRALAYWQKAGVVKADAMKEEKPQAGEAKKVSSERQQAAQESSAARMSVSSGEIEKLSGDTEFSQLLYIAQKYLNKVFTPMDCEVFAYLYSTLQMPAELLEYLVEYCAQNNHSSIRYIEKVAINWHEKKLNSVEEARAYAKSFSKDTFAVMKAFGLTGRNPGEKEFEDIERWFKDYGFTKEIVTEACNRTMEAIHTPSFQYADQILKEWKKVGVKAMRDITELDKARLEQRENAQKDKAAGQRRTGPGKAKNRFHNLEEHDYDYDKMVWNMISTGQKDE